MWRAHPDNTVRGRPWRDLLAHARARCWPSAAGRRRAAGHRAGGRQTVGARRARPPPGCSPSSAPTHPVGIVFRPGETCSVPATVDRQGGHPHRGGRTCSAPRIIGVQGQGRRRRRLLGGPGPAAMGLPPGCSGCSTGSARCRWFVQGRPSRTRRLPGFPDGTCCAGTARPGRRPPAMDRNRRESTWWPTREARPSPEERARPDPGHGSRPRGGCGSARAGVTAFNVLRADRPARDLRRPGTAAPAAPHPRRRDPP